ncbi:MAG: alpha-glucan family phosphorylase [Solirubrobacteraceae bacterium]
MERGEQDIARAAAHLESRVPEPLAALARIAYNYCWSWFPNGPDVFGSVDRHRWELCGENPVRLLQEASGESLSRAAADPEILARAASLERRLSAELTGSATADPSPPERPIAFFCAEYAIHRSLPIYAGGLGALAGDFIKEASDRAMPLVGVGLMYRQGSFHQRIDTLGLQHEYWLDTDPERLPMALVTAADGRPLTVSVPIWNEHVVAQIWRVDVGRVPLFLLDAERPDNRRPARWITSQLYVGDPITRLAQYALLGIGGVRALEALGVEPGLIHLNEGHAALASLELARTETARDVPLDKALEAARQRVVFTTHTPLPAGNDTYPAEEVGHALGAFASELGLDADSLVRLGRSHPDNDEPFGVTQLALRMSRAANGVSRRHGGVARAMWQDLWPGRPIDSVPIAHVTNGVHLPTWLGTPMRRLLDRHLGEHWLRQAADPATWAALDAVPDAELWAVRCQQRAELVDFVRDRSMADRLARGEIREYVQAAAQAFDPRVLTIGFARRVATYKRLHLLVQDPDRSLRLLAGERPIQIVLAGKAHPSDDEAKHVVQTIFSLRSAPNVGAQVIYLHDYDIGMAGRLVQGCDVWVNLPRPPLEASGTSGMKSVANGGLQLSVLDGWWAEGYNGANGWALSGDVDVDHEAQDARDSAELYRLLEQEILPTFYARDAGLPRKWLSRIRGSMRSLVPAFCASRMLDDYTERVYRTHGSPGA